MHKSIIFILTICTLTFFSCQNTTQDQEPETQSSVSIPELLDRTEALQQDLEWDNVQNIYGKNRSKIMADPTAEEPKIKLAEVFINEARVTGEHGHYYPAALQMLNSILDKSSDNPDITFRALSHKAGVLLSLHQFAEALEVGQKAVALNPYNAHIHGVLVDAYVELGDYESAVKMADKMVSIRPDLRSYARVSYLREIHGDVDGAIEAMKLAVSAGYPGYEQTAWTRLTLGELYETYGFTDEAEQEYKMALAERPDYPFAIAALANLEMEKGNLEAAEKQLKAACEIIPEVGFYEQLAHLYKKQGKTDAMKKTVEEIFPMLEDDVANGHQMNLEYAHLYLDLLDAPEKALEYAMIEYGKRPKNIDVNLLLAEIYLELDDSKNMQKHYTSASKTNSKNPILNEMKAKLAIN
jgi:tetratricopeptide (TPR) repeat protein